MECRHSISIFPSSYEYALMSKLAYADKPDEKNPEECFLLIEKGWSLSELIEEGGYYAHIWVNHEKRQVVVTHRGSQNATSWITDIESVIQLKPGEFIVSALEVLGHKTILEYREKGYRLSTTGHSLGGFLAQVCVFWSQRRDREKTFYPDMSAVVFDSPGVVDFLKVLQSNLESEKNAIRLDFLNIHNFCAMPTLVSTFGTQTGTIWHLSGAEDEKFAFVSDHLMAHMLQGFDPETGQPKDFRQMTDWPQADYGAYLSMTKAMGNLVSTAIKLPFDCLNALYKSIKRSSRDTWYDKIFSDEGEVSSFLKEHNYRPELSELEEQITFAIKSHYATYGTEEKSKTRIGIHHFDLKIQEFLNDFYIAKKYNFNILASWLEGIFGKEGIELLSKFSLEKHGDKIEVILLPEYNKSIFDFQSELMFLMEKQEKIPSIPEIIGNKIESKEKELNKNLIRLGEKQDKKEAKFNEGMERLQKEINELKEITETINKGRLIALRSPIAEVRDSIALRVIGKNNYEEGRKDFAMALERGQQGDEIRIDSPAAKAAGAVAMVISEKEEEELLSFFRELGLFSLNSPSKVEFQEEFHDHAMEGVEVKENYDKTEDASSSWTWWAWVKSKFSFNIGAAAESLMLPEDSLSSSQVLEQIIPCIADPSNHASSENASSSTLFLNAEENTTSRTNKIAPDPISTPDAVSNMMLGVVLIKMAENTFKSIASSISYSSTNTFLSEEKQPSEITEADFINRSKLIKMQNKCRKLRETGSSADKWFGYFLEDLENDIEDTLNTNAAILYEIDHYQKRLRNLVQEFNDDAELDYAAIYSLIKQKQGKKEKKKVAAIHSITTCSMFTVGINEKQILSIISNQTNHLLPVLGK